jgi:hypothetical protein
VIALSRRPSAAELERLSEHVAKAENKQRAFEDVLWAVLNTREFMFNH